MKLALERGWLAMHESGTSCGSHRLVRNCSPKQQKTPEPFRAISGLYVRGRGCPRRPSNVLLRLAF
jgi:hypothetical protein